MENTNLNSETKPNEERKPKEKKKKSKEKKKKPKEKKKQEYDIKLDPKIIDTVEKLDLTNIFINNSSLKNDTILNAIIIYNKVFDYKCNNPKCLITNEWLENPIKLLLIRKNNKQQDLRMTNLEYKCYNCYFQENSSDDLFNKVKKEVIITCKVCDFNMSMLSKTYKDSQICKICTAKYSRSTSKMESYSLFHNTFDNTLSKEDIKNDLSIQTGYNDSLNSSIPSPFPILTKTNGSNTKHKEIKQNKTQKNTINIPVNELDNDMIEQFKLLMNGI
jgi:hypothetical protein